MNDLVADVALPIHKHTRAHTHSLYTGIMYVAEQIDNADMIANVRENDGVY